MSNPISAIHRWEYFVTPVLSVTEMNALGNSGWELVTSTCDPESGDYLRHTFKRACGWIELIDVSTHDKPGQLIPGQ